MFKLLNGFNSKPVQEGPIDWIVLTAGAVMLTLALTASVSSRMPDLFETKATSSVQL